MIYDLIVLGGGPAGYLAAERAAHAGMSVVCIEKNSLGGVCLNEGCIPTKTLLYSAKTFESALHGDKYGVFVEGAKLDHNKVIDRKQKVIKSLVAGVKSTLRKNGARVIMGEGVIKKRTAEGFVIDAGGETVVGKRLLLATGSGPAVPPIDGLREQLERGFVMTSREALELRQVPDRLVVIGGGVIGLEMASYYASAGSQVTIVEMLDHIAGQNDPELVSLLQKGYENRGMKFMLSTRVTKLTADSVVCEKDGEITELKCDKVLLSIGRRANTSGIGLENIGVITERGAVVTDEYMRTNIAEVYAAGDINGKSMLAHTAYREAEVAVNNMLGKRDIMRYNAIPGVIYTTPELSSVGETEATARAKGMDIKVVKLPMIYSGRYLAENEDGDGVCKVIFNNRTKTIVGAQALGNYSSEFIVAVGTFIETELTVDELKEIVFPHPTVCEIIREAIFQY
ncbi:MAG: dihydrolipoyl dehydrogenase [Clostridia bacterium]|nr:dihydrolipoyl dehydrogenase [Clostridia bacterium]MBR5903586.1 dihydrolipoyl dehydrogenase [Clostridia bacterium]